MTKTTLWITLAAALTATGVDYGHAGAEEPITASRFSITIDGQPVAGVVNASGAAITTKPTTRIATLAAITHEPLNVEVGMGMGQELWDWVKASIDKGHVARDLTIQDNDSVRAPLLAGAGIAAFTVPALDGTSKDAGYFTLTIQPEAVRFVAVEPAAVAAPPQKTWLASNFRFELAGLPSKRVRKVDSFTWKQTLVHDEDGHLRLLHKKPAPLAIHRLVVTIPAADGAAWRKWHKRFAAADDKDALEKTGSLILLGPDMREALATIDLKGVGVRSIEPVEAAKGTPYLKIELYVETISLS